MNVEQQKEAHLKQFNPEFEVGGLVHIYQYSVDS